MKFNPNDGSECLPAGEYNAEVANAQEAKSKAGNDMLKITFKVFGPARESFVYDYIVNPSSLFKLSKLCKVIGLGKRYDSGEVKASELVGKGLRVVLVVESDKTGKYGDRNSVKAYKAASAAGATVAETEDAEDELDEASIPF